MMEMMKDGAHCGVSILVCGFLLPCENLFSSESDGDSGIART